MIIKLSRTGKFYSCAKYPDCDGARKIDGTELAGPKETGELCPLCGEKKGKSGGGKLVIREGRFGAFISCSRYPKCKFIKEDEEEKKKKMTGVVCPVCQKGEMMERRGRFGIFYSCSNYPDCKNIKPLSLGIKCPEEGCDGEIFEKRTKKGRIFYGCNRFPGCKFASWNKLVNMACTNCGSPALVENKNGETLSCPRCKSQFNREDVEASK